VENCGVDTVILKTAPSWEIGRDFLLDIADMKLYRELPLGSRFEASQKGGDI
jgi:hypothetical protein